MENQANTFIADQAAWLNRERQGHELVAGLVEISGNYAERIDRQTGIRYGCVRFKGQWYRADGGFYL